MKRFLFLISIIVLIILAVWGGNYLLNLGGEGDGGVSSGGGRPISVLPGGIDSDGGGRTSSGGRATSSGGQGGGSDELEDLPGLLRPKGGFGVVVDREVFDYAITEEGSLIFIQATGQIAELSSDEVEVLSSVSISNLRYASFSPDAKKVVVVFGEVDSPQVSVFDVEDKSWEPLFIYPQSWPVWAPDNYRLAYITEENGSLSLEIINAGAANPTAQRLVMLNAFDLEAFWKTSNEIIISQKATFFANQEAFVYNISQRTLNQFLGDEKGLVYLWNPLIDQGVVFANSDSLRGGTLDLVDSAGKRTKRFSFVALPREKCSFLQLPNLAVDPNDIEDSEIDLVEASLVCALPRSEGVYANYNLPDDYWQGLVLEPERLVKVSLYSGTYQTITGTTTGLFDAKHIRLGEDILYFINRTDGKVYGVDFPVH